MYFNYQEITEDFLQELPSKAREILVKRFGFITGRRETLQSVGNGFGITRERVRQIEKASLSKISEKLNKHQPVFDFFQNQLKTTGNLRKEEVLFEILSPGMFRNQVLFLLSVASGFNRVLETTDFYTLWTIDRRVLNSAQRTVSEVAEKLKKVSKPVDVSGIASFSRIRLPALLAYIEASKIIQKGPQGLWGLRDWPAISPKGVGDKAHIIFLRENRPIHFTEVAELINKSGLFADNRKAHPQTVHNELIKDEKFVLVGRGVYALTEWGYKPGTVKDVVMSVLKEVKKPLTQEEVVQRVLKQRLVAQNTILLNLHDRKHFSRDPEGKYTLVKS